MIVIDIATCEADGESYVIHAGSKEDVEAAVLADIDEMLSYEKSGWNPGSPQRQLINEIIDMITDGKDAFSIIMNKYWDLRNEYSMWDSLPFINIRHNFQIHNNKDASVHKDPVIRMHNRFGQGKPYITVYPH